MLHICRQIRRQDRILPKFFEPCHSFSSLNADPIKIKKKRRMGFVVGFVGTGYYGLQKQNVPGLKTIEGELEEALYKAGCISDSNYGDLLKIGFKRSSRTDKNVHASRVVLSAKLLVHADDLDEHRSQPGLVSAINFHLPPSIRVFSCKQVPKSFNPRDACTAREYQYILPLENIKTCMRGVGMEINQANLHYVIDSFQNQIKTYKGLHDFHNFTSKHRLGKLLKNRNVQDNNNPSSCEATTMEKYRKNDTSLENDEDDTSLENDEDVTSLENDEDDDKEPQLNRFQVVSRQWQHSATRPKIQRYKRLIYSISCSDPIDLCNEEVLVIQLTGDAFVFNQIRCMIGAALATSIEILPTSLFNVALHTGHIVRVPVAPAEGLLLLRSLYSRNPGKVAFDQSDMEKECGDELPDTTLLSPEENQLASQYLNEMIYPHLLENLRQENVFEEWVENIKAFCPTEEEEVSLQTIWESARDRNEEYKLHREKQSQIHRLDKSKDDVHFKDVLPPGFSSLIAVRFNILPGPYIHWIQRGVFLHMIKGNLPVDSSTESCLTYIETVGHSSLANEGKQLPVQCTAKHVQNYLSEQTKST